MVVVSFLVGAMDYYDGYDDEYKDDEDDDYDYYEERRLEDDWDDVYRDDMEFDAEYQRSEMNFLQRAWLDFSWWVYGTRLCRKWSDWKYRREHGFIGEEIPF
jgi:hypothetical protein